MRPEHGIRTQRAVSATTNGGGEHRGNKNGQCAQVSSKVGFTSRNFRDTTLRNASNSFPSLRKSDMVGDDRGISEKPLHGRMDGIDMGSDTGLGVS